jgi:hypothetical protein
MPIHSTFDSIVSPIRLLFSSVFKEIPNQRVCIHVL